VIAYLIASIIETITQTNAAEMNEEAIFLIQITTNNVDAKNDGKTLQITVSELRVH
jgi:hypothetical protein